MSYWNLCEVHTYRKCYLLCFAYLRKSTHLQIEAGLLQKEYIAKVIGIFPDSEVFILINIRCHYFVNLYVFELFLLLDSNIHSVLVIFNNSHIF